MKSESNFVAYIFSLFWANLKEMIIQIVQKDFEEYEQYELLVIIKLLLLCYYNLKTQLKVLKYRKWKRLS